jgi:hypothetical protein
MDFPLVKLDHKLIHAESIAEMTIKEWLIAVAVSSAVMMAIAFVVLLFKLEIIIVGSY